MSFILRPAAEKDIQEISKYIAADSPTAARNWRREILETCRMLGELPALGTSRDDIPNDLRTFPKGKYIIVFRSAPSAIVVVRVVHSARDWPKLVR
jgi:toxin ParE1/3/4